MNLAITLYQKGILLLFVNSLILINCSQNFFKLRDPPARITLNAQSNYQYNTSESPYGEISTQQITEDPITQDESDPYVVIKSILVTIVILGAYFGGWHLYKKCDQKKQQRLLENPENVKISLRNQELSG